MIRCIELDEREKLEVNGKVIKINIWYAVLTEEKGAITNFNTYQDV